MGTPLSVIFIGYIALTIIVSWIFRSRGEKKKEQFLIYDHKLGLGGMVASSIASTLDNSNLIFAVGVALLFGSGAFVIYGGICIGIIISGLLAPLFWKLARKHGMLTSTDFFLKRMGIKTNWIAGLATVFMTFAWMSAAFFANAILLNTMFGWDRYTATLVTGLIVLLYSVLGGFKTMVKTDMFQLAVLILVLIMALIIPTTVSMESVFSDGNLFTPITLITMGMLILANFFNAGLWQKAIAAKTPQIARKGIMMYGLGFFIVILPLVWVSFQIAAAIPGVTVDTAFYQSLAQILPAWFTPIALIAMYAALMSSIDTMLFGTALNAAKNLLAPIHEKVKNNIALITKILMVLFVVLSALVSWYLQSLISFILTLISVFGIFAFPFVVGIFKKIPDWLGVLAILSGVAAYAMILTVDYFALNYAWNLLPGIVPGIVLGIALLTHPKLKRSTISR